jgi:hypothetical protein
MELIIGRPLHGTNFFDLRLSKATEFARFKEEAEGVPSPTSWVGYSRGASGTTPIRIARPVAENVARSLGAILRGSSVGDDFRAPWII